MAADPVAVTPPARPPHRSLGSGWRTVARKEFADYVLSVRFGIVLLLVGVAVALSVYSAAGTITDAASEASGTPSLFLRLFTIEGETLSLSFTRVVGWLVPLLGIAFGFDAVNGERAAGTLPRLLSQPIHRDDVINGKFAAGLAVITVMLFSLTLTVAGIGLLRLGIVPTGDEVTRMLAWMLVTLVYAAFWLGLSSLASVAFRHQATSALVAIAAWLVFTLFAGLIIGIVGDLVAPLPAEATFEEQIHSQQVEQTISRVFPSALHEEATIVLLAPSVRAVTVLSPLQYAQLQGYGLGGELSLDQSLLLAWPQVVILVAMTVICFAAAYVLFMRQEVRA